MPRLLVLGPPDVRDNAGDPIPALTGRDKRLALLAFLAVERPAGIRRDALLPLFWPDLDDPHARNALRQALTLLRRELGEGAIPGHGSETIAVHASALHCDARDFEALCAEERWEEALALHRGEFLEGLHLPDCGDLDRWIEDRRARYRALAATAASTASEVALSAGRGHEALMLARKGVAIAPLSEANWRRLIETEARTLGRADAMGTYAVLRQRLRDDLGAEPEPATLVLVGAIQTGAVGPADHILVPAPVNHAATPTPAAPAGASPRRRFRDVVLAASSVAAVALIAVVTRSRPPDPVLDPGRVYVDRFRTGGTDTTLASLQEGLPELFVFLFTGVGSPKAVEPALTARPRQDAANTEQVALTRASSLGAGWLVRGSAVQLGSRLIVNAQLIDVASGRVEAEGAAEGPPDSLLSLVERAGTQLLSGKARVSPGALSDLLTRSPAPLRRVLAGLALYRKGGYQEAVGKFREAVRLDSTFALAAAYLAMASVWTRTGVIDLDAVRLAERHAGRLPPSVRALMSAYGRTGTWPANRRAWELATETMPNEPLAWERLGDQLFHEAGFLSDPRALESSADAFMRAVALDSSRGTPLLHLMDLAARRGDTAGVRRWGQAFLAADSGGELRGYAEWRMAVAHRAGTSGLVEKELSRMTPASRRDILGTAILDDLDPAILDPAEHSTRAWIAGSTDTALRYRTSVQLYLALVNRGEVARAVVAGRAMEDEERRMRGGSDPALSWYTEMMAALYGGADRVAAAALAPRLEAMALSASRPPGTDGALLHAYAAAVVALWHAHAGDSAAASRFADRARRLGTVSASSLATSTVTTTLTILQAGNGGSKLAALDSLVRTGPLGNVLTEAAASLALAHHLASRGDTAAALGALTRRRYYQPLPVFVSSFRSDSMRWSHR